MHRQYQQQVQIPRYHREMLLQGEFSFESLTFHVTGKADGLYESGDTVVIEEIKTTIADLKVFHQQHETWHMMQGLFYGYMYALLYGKTTIEVKLIFCIKSMTTDLITPIPLRLKKPSEIYKRWSMNMVVFMRLS